MRRPRTRADSSVSRPTTAPIMSFLPPVTCFSGRARCKIRPSDPPTNTAAPTASANFSGFIQCSPVGRPQFYSGVTLPRSGESVARQAAGGDGGDLAGGVEAEHEARRIAAQEDELWMAK